MVDITFDDVTNASTTTDGTGYFDKIVQTTLLHIQNEASSGRIKGTEYATVYLGGLQSAMQHAIQFVLQEKLTEAQIEGIQQDNLLKAKQLEIAEKDLLLKDKELLLRDKELLIQEQELLLKAEQLVVMRAELAIKEELTGAQITGINKDNEVKTEQVTMSIFERQFIQPKNLEKLEEEIAHSVAQTEELVDSTIRANTQLDDQLLTSAKQRVVADKEIELKAEQVLISKEEVLVKKENVLIAKEEVLIKKDSLLTAAKQRLQIEAQTEEILNGTIRANTQLDDQLLTSAKQRDELDERIDLLQTQDRGEVYKVDNLLPEELRKLQEEIDKIEKEQLATEARMRDEFGFQDNGQGEIVEYTTENTKHKHAVELVKNQVLTEIENTTLTGNRANAAKMDEEAKKGQIIQELNGVYDTTLDAFSFQPAVVVDGDLKFFTTVAGQDRTNPYLMKLYREFQENKIAEATATGYRGDAVYKSYKSLQELFFAMANMGIEVGESGPLNEAEEGTAGKNPYARITQAMDKLINAHMTEWGITLPAAASVNRPIKLTNS
jgi:hypothetical protein